MNEPLRYKGFTIQYNPPPVPSRKFDYEFWHDDYNGPGDKRCGHAASPEAAMVEIDEIIADQEIQMENRMKPSIDTMRALVVADPRLFESLVPKFGLAITGRINNDPLVKSAQTEAIDSIASIITESVNENNDDQLDNDAKNIRRIAESYGYIIGLVG